MTDLDDIISTSDFQKWHSDLHRKKNYKPPVLKKTEDRQSELLDALNLPPSEIQDYLLAQLGTDESMVRAIIPSLNVTLDEKNFLEIPIDIEKEIFDCFSKSGLEITFAAQSRYWTLCHAVWIKDGNFTGSILDIFCKITNSRQLKSIGSEKNSYLAHNFLHRSGGFPPSSGPRSVYIDCPSSRAFWRCHLSQLISSASAEEKDKSISLSFEEVYNVLSHSDLWRYFVRYLFNGIIALNAPRALVAFIAAIYEMHPSIESSQKSSSPISRNQTNNALQSLGQLGNDYNLHYVSFQKMVERAMAGLSGTTSVDSSDDDDAEYDEDQPS